MRAVSHFQSSILFFFRSIFKLGIKQTQQISGTINNSSSKFEKHEKHGKQSECFRTGTDITVFFRYLHLSGVSSGRENKSFYYNVYSLNGPLLVL